MLRRPRKFGVRFRQPYREAEAAGNIVKIHHIVMCSTFSALLPSLKSTLKMFVHFKPDIIFIAILPE